MAESGNALKESADFARGCDSPTPDHDSDICVRKSRVRTEQERLIEWAHRTRKIGRIPPIPEFGRGGEHVVMFHQRKSRFFKTTRPDRQLGYGCALSSYHPGATPSEYLDRLDLQNQVFEDDIKLEWVVENSGVPIVVISQPAIKGSHASPRLIAEMMITLGFERLTDEAFYDGRGLLVFDLAPRNVIQVASGHVFPIDPVIQRIDPEFGDFLREHPERIPR